LYLKAPTHQAKKDVCEEILKMMRGRFLRFVSTRNAWVEISEEAARIKVAQAFQYRQRRGGQLEGNQDDIHSQKLGTYSRKRTATPVQATWPPVIYLEAHRTMQSLDTLKSGDTQITTEEILWALGMQPSLPEQQQHHHQIANPISYGDDLAIGRPATTIASQKKRQYEAFPSTSMPGVADHNAALRLNSMLASAATRTESTASLLQAQLLHQSGQFQVNIFQEAGQSHHLPQPITQLQDLYRQQIPLNVSNMSSFPDHNPDIREVVPHGFSLESHGMQMPLSLQGQQSFQRDSQEGVRWTVDSFANINPLEGYVINQQSSSFDSSFVPSPTLPIHQVRCNSLSDSFSMSLHEPLQIHDQEQLATATTRPPYDISSVQPNDLLLDPLPLDDNESLRSYGEQDENSVLRNNGPQ
jgi:hypothetical protein